MNAYQWLKMFGNIKSTRTKLLGLLTLHLLKKRYMGVFLDPSLACNLRCRMCYFSDPNHKIEPPVNFKPEELRLIAKALFHRTLKLQIGCGAEPTMYPRLEEIVQLGKRHGVPYISVTSNGKLLTEEKLVRLAEAGLDELTLSCHGLTAATYEHLMTGAHFADFTRLLGDISRVKERHPQFKLRINYTLNADNVEELTRFDEVFARCVPDILQLRPIQHIGDSDYQNFSLEKIAECYDRVILPLAERCAELHTTCLLPGRDNLTRIEASETGTDTRRKGAEAALEELTYCYIAPGACWKPDFDFRHDTFETYCRRQHRTRYIIGRLLGAGRRKRAGRSVTQRLNYKIKG